MIAREWKCRCPKQHTEAFLDYMHATGVTEAAGLPGYMGSQVMLREVDGMNEVTLLTYWDSMASIQAFAGPEPDKARLYPEDAKYGIEADAVVRHYEVVGEG